jgi:hypothetical protein
VRSSLRSMPGMRSISIARQRLVFSGSTTYWERRYDLGGTSGAGSYGDLARYKAEFLNSFTRERGISTVTEFGCGDGNQLSLAEYPAYIGLDISRTAIRLCKERFAPDITKSFFLYDSSCHIDRTGIFTADMAISLDVVYHLVEDSVFEEYMTHLFEASRKYVVVYATNDELVGTAPHVRHRKFSSWVELNCPRWRLTDEFCGPPVGGGQADFFVYERLLNYP